MDRYGVVYEYKKEPIHEDATVVASAVFLAALLGFNIYGAVQKPIRKKLEGLKYKYTVSKKPLKSIPKWGYDDEKTALGIHAYFDLGYNKSDKGVIYRTSDSKSDAIVYLYKFNSKDLKLIETGKFEDVCKKYNIQIKNVDKAALSDRKLAYDTALKEFKAGLKGNKLLNNSYTSWGVGKDGDDYLQKFCNGVRDDIGIYYLSIHRIMPDARTKDDDRQTWMNKEIYGKLEEVAKDVNSKLPKGYKVEYVGDWDDLDYWLSAKG
jgi:hypothetical protein